MLGFSPQFAFTPESVADIGQPKLHVLDGYEHRNSLAEAAPLGDCWRCNEVDCHSLLNRERDARGSRYAIYLF